MIGEGMPAFPQFFYAPPMESLANVALVLDLKGYKSSEPPCSDGVAMNNLIGATAPFPKDHTEKIHV